MLRNSFFKKLLTVSVLAFFAMLGVTSSSQQAVFAQNDLSVEGAVTGGALFGPAGIIVGATEGEDIGKEIEKFFTEGTTGNSSGATSFTEFTGGLEPPPTEGYSPGLVQATSAREYILNVTNFALGFLGLIAIIIVIYGGFLYVTAAGKEEQAGKGKKSIMYALIGIVIILGSYALVNTILQAPRGTDDGTQLSGAAPTGGGTTSTEQAALRRTLFNIAGVQVTTIATDFLNSYRNFSENRTALSTFNQIPELQTSVDFSVLAKSKITILKNIEAKSRSLGEIRGTITGHIDAVNQYLQQSDSAFAKANGNQTQWTEEFWQNEQNNFSLAIGQIQADLNLANQNDFAFQVAITKEQIIELKSKIGNAAGLEQVKASFDQVEKELSSIVSGSTTSYQPSFWRALIPVAYAKPELLNESISNNDILRVIEAFKKLYVSVNNIVFVYAAITADVTEGNAPFIVNLDGLRSQDPNNQTVPNENFTWNFGDGSPEENGVTQNHIFMEPGTYVVKLNVKSTDPKAIADGFASINITVRPPNSRINLKALINGVEEPIILRQYDGVSGRMISDTNTLKVTPSEAAAGITFDASGSTSGGTAGEQGSTEAITKVRWNFGDNTTELLGDKSVIELTQKHIYSQPGRYRVLLEVTDNRNNTDRKIVNVLVGSPTTRITVSPTVQGKVGQFFTFDGGSSSSDSGQIQKWNWKYTKAGSGDIKPTIEGLENSETQRVSFSEPGIYSVSLGVEDNLGATDLSTINVAVESEAPVAQFHYKITDKSQPAVVELDGTRSYDPDGKDPLQYQWEINGEKKIGPASPYEYVNGTNANSPKPKIKFKKVGTYSVTLVTIDPNGFGPGKPQESEPTEREVTIENILDIAWGDKDVPAAILVTDPATNEPAAKVQLNVKSENAVAYEIDYGDGQKENGDFSKNKTFTHIYKEAGMKLVKVSVFDKEDKENFLIRKVFIGSDTTPVAMVSIRVNGNEIFDTTQPIVVNRKDTVTVSGKNSLNIDGTGRRLNYSLDFGDNTRDSKEEANHVYKDLGEYNVGLKVTNSQDVSQSATDSVTVRVVGEAPTLQSMTAVPVGNSLVTPVTVTVNAIGAGDSDGRIVSYRWWYYDPNNDTEKMGDQVTSQPTATFIIGTRGEENQQRTYKFGLEMIDNENNSVLSNDIMDEKLVPTLTVTNGPNKSPNVVISADRTSILVGETINFSSNATDPDGNVMKYFWDFEGDGFANNTTPGSSIESYTFKKAAPAGIKIRLKVIDNNESEAVSDPITIFVDSTAEPPVAAFTTTQEGSKVIFRNTSTADEKNGLTLKKFIWDFNTAVDSNGNGKRDDDVDSGDENPTHEYTSGGTYEVKLIVEDSEGSRSEVTNSVSVKSANGENQTTPSLQAKLLSTPPTGTDNKIHLKGQKAIVIFDYSTSSGDIRKITIDKNIFHDSNGDGIKDNDEDHASLTLGKWNAAYDKSLTGIKARLTVTDGAGKTDSVEKEIVFDASSESTFLSDVFASSQGGTAFALVSIAGFAILILNNLRRK